MKRTAPKPTAAKTADSCKCPRKKKTGKREDPPRPTAEAFDRQYNTIAKDYDF